MFYINQVIILQFSPPSLHYCTLPKKASLSLSVSTRREYIWKLNWNESLLIYLENFQGVPCSHTQSRNRMMNTFIIVNITPYMEVRDSLEDKSVHFKKAFPLTLLGRTYLKEELTDYFTHFESYQDVPYSYTGKQSRQRMVNTLLMIKINLTCKRLLIFICQEKKQT